MHASNLKKLEVGSQKLELRSQKLELRSRNSEVGSQKSELRSRKSEVGTQNSELRSWNSEVGTQKSELRSQKSELRSGPPRPSYLTNPRIQMFLMDAKKSTDIAESVCEKNVRILLKIPVPEFRPAHRNFRPAPSNPRKKLNTRAFYPHPRLLPAPAPSTRDPRQIVYPHAKQCDQMFVSKFY